MIVIAVSNVLVIFAIAYQVFRRNTVLRKFFWPALLFKLLAGIVLGLLYIYHYKEGDTIAFYDDALKIAALARSEFSDYVSFLWNSGVDPEFFRTLVLQQPRALFMAKIGSFFCLLTGGNYWIIALWFSFISFLGTWVLVRELVAFNPRLRDAAAIAFLFFPSVVFWSSGFIKESVAFAMLCVFIAVFVRAWRRLRVPPSGYVVMALALWLLWNLKYYYLAVLLPVLATELLYEYLLRRHVEHRHYALKLLSWCLLFLAPLLLVSVLHPNFHPSGLLTVITVNHDAFVSLSREGEYIHFSHLQATPGSMLLNAPLALVSGMFRPLPWETHGFIAALASAENLIFLVLTAYSAYLLVQRKVKLSRGGGLILVYSILLCVFLALSTPNFGTLSRYRIGFLPFMVLLVCAENPLIERLTGSRKLVRDH